MYSYNPRNWAAHLFDIEGSMVVEIMGRVIFCVLWSVLVVILYDYGPEYFDKLAIVETAHTLIGASLGMLLVFRTNSSYDRFWEGRKQWGGIVNETRNLARQTEAWLASDTGLMRKCISLTAGFAYATRNRLRGTNEAGLGSGENATDELANAQQARHVPLAIARKLSELFTEARSRGVIDSIQLYSLDQNVQLLVDYCGACERIRSTPAPYAYVIHLRRSLILYCLTLPLALVRNYDWETVLVTLVVSYVMFGIEEIGVEIENPFGTTVNDLPLDSICDGIDGDLRSVVQERLASE